MKELSVISDSGFQQFWLQIQHEKLKSIILCVVYKPPNCPVSRCVDDFMDNYTRALMFGKEIFVVGNLNCDMLRKVRKLMLLMIYACHCITSESSTLIDIIMTSDDSLVTEGGVEEIHISDHFLVYSILKLKLPKPAPIYFTKFFLFLFFILQNSPYIRITITQQNLHTLNKCHTHNGWNDHTEMKSPITGFQYKT